jgi:hypothetical protein
MALMEYSNDWDGYMMAPKPFRNGDALWREHNMPGRLIYPGYLGDGDLAYAVNLRTYFYCKKTFDPVQWNDAGHYGINNGLLGYNDDNHKNIRLIHVKKPTKLFLVGEGVGQYNVVITRPNYVQARHEGSAVFTYYDGHTKCHAEFEYSRGYPEFKKLPFGNDDKSIWD